ncbi:MAG TPA: hypothetical protein VKK79_09525 [Candidatus Lokiarchaeia archaeon]|nr:hypothetical protein [Candidatus Lokiarchaeia archaeon]
MAELRNLVLRVAQCLKSAQIEYVIVGGFAAIARGMPRTTMDLDVIIENDPEKILQLFTALKERNFDIIDYQAQSAMLAGSNISIFDDLSPLRVDLKVAVKKIDRIALKHAKSESYEGIQINIASPELILFGKVLYLGDIGDIPDDELLEYGDVRDFFAVVQQAAELNLDWIRKRVAEQGLAETFERLYRVALDNSSKEKWTTDE